MCKKCKRLGATTVVPRISLDRPIPMDQFLGVRKGAWCEDEDCRLRKCVEEYGEGNWRLVPLRAGLNRCRKSCRLRWLNYLHPKIKRGEFASDEVDLIIRMHNLLGNRWSLIAGRIPGRTANDIKNYWNTYIKKTLLPKSSNSNKEKKPMELQTTTTKIEVLRPQPRRTFSKNLVSMKSTTVQPGGETPNKPTMEMFKELDDPEWWKDILFDKDVDGCGKGHLPNFDIHDIEAQADGKIASVEEESVWYDLCFSAMDTLAP